MLIREIGRKVRLHLGCFQLIEFRVHLLLHARDERSITGRTRRDVRGRDIGQRLSKVSVRNRRKSYG